MNKSELIVCLVRRHACGLDAVTMKRAVESLLAALATQLAIEGRVEIRNFGSFRTKMLAPRVSRNPRSGKPIEVPARRVVRFKPSGALKARVAASIVR